MKPLAPIWAAVALSLQAESTARGKVVSVAALDTVDLFVI